MAMSPVLGYSGYESEIVLNSNLICFLYPHSVESQKSLLDLH